MRCNEVIVTRPYARNKTCRGIGSLVLEAKNSICVCDPLRGSEGAPEVTI